LSDPKAHELFLDPFCGSGAIPIQRAKHFARGLVIASDNDQRAIDSLKKRVTQLGLKKRIVVRHDDALHLTRYDRGSILKIVTDPPWGHFVATQLPLEIFYQEMMTEFARILRPGGRLVLLVGTTPVLDSIIRTQQEMTQLHRYHILLSGKKATVYVLARKRPSCDLRAPAASYV
jgi:tRNA G10  N-methylase Trm11